MQRGVDMFLVVVSMLNAKDLRVELGQSSFNHSR